MKCVIVDCDHEALPRDVVCSEHAAYYRQRDCEADRCLFCGRRMTTVHALFRGYCLGCKLSTPERRAALFRKKRHRFERLERNKVRQREQREAMKEVMA